MKVLFTNVARPKSLVLALLLLVQVSSNAKNSTSGKLMATPTKAAIYSVENNAQHTNRPQGAQNLFVNMSKNTVSGYATVDQAKFVVNSIYASNGIGSNKLLNGADNLAILFGTKVLSICGYKTITTADTITLSVTLLTANTAYRLQLITSQFALPGFQPQILDRFTKTLTTLTSDTTTIAFTPTADVNTYGKRFAIAFKSTTLPINLFKLTAERQKEGVNISWNTLGESKMDAYSVESSIDGREYKTLSTVKAKNTLVANYSFTDAKPSKQAIYYRIKGVDVDGRISYSNVAIVAAIKASVSIYPNPLVGKNLYISGSELPAGKNNVDLYNSLGKKVYTTTIDGSLDIHNVKVGTLAAGTYSLIISSEGKVVYTTNLQVK